MEWLWEKVLTALYAIMLSIDGAIYSILNSIYKIYIALASARLLTNGMFTEIANRFYAIIGVVMLFVMAYVVIQGIVNPDNFAKAGGEGSQLLKRIGIAVLGLALVPGVFRIVYTGQDVILSQNLIGKIFLGYDDPDNIITHGDVSIDDQKIEFDSDGDNEPDDGEINQNDAINTSAGTVAAMSLWQAVFYPSNIDSEDDLDKEAEEIKTDLPGSAFIRGTATLTKWGCGIAIAVSIFTLGAALLGAAALCGAAVVSNAIDGLEGKTVSLKQAYGAAAATGNFTVFVAFAGKVASGDITYKFFFSTVIGAVSAWLFLSFAIDMAVRAVKLVYMQIIAPVPLMLQILPKFKDNFNKWLKTVLSLFMEVFIRLTFVYIVAYLISHLWAIMSGGWLDRANLNPVEMFLARVILIIGMLMFAKTAPQFISETLGISSGNLSLGIRKKLAEGGVLSKVAAVGGIGANFFSGGLTNARNKWKEAHKNHGNTLSGLAAVGGFVTGSFGRAARNARRTILDAKAGVNNLRDIRDKVQDSYARGQKDDADRAYKKEKKRQELAQKGYDPENGEGGVLRWMTAERQARGNKVKEFMRDNFTALPPSLAEWEGKLKIQADLRELEGKLQDVAIAENENYKNAVAQRAELDTPEGRKEAAKKVAEAMAANGEISSGDLQKIKESPEELEKFMQVNSNAVSQQLMKDKVAADEKVKKAKANAVNEELEKERIAGGGKVTDALKTFMVDHADTFKKYGNEIINDEKGQPITFKEYMARNFGAGYEKGDISHDAALGNYTGAEKEYEIVADDGTRGVVKYRRVGNDMKITFDDGTGPVDVKNIGNKKMVIATPSGGEKKLSGVKIAVNADGTSTFKTLDSTSFTTDDSKKLTSGTVLGMAQNLGGTVQYTTDSGAQKKVTIKQTSSGITGQVITGQVSTGDIELSALSTALTGAVDAGGHPASVIVDGGPAVVVDAQVAGGEPIKVSLQNAGGTVSATLDGVATPISLSGGNISLADVAISEGEIPISTVASSLKLEDGGHTITLGGKALDIQVSSGSVASCSEIVVSPALVTDASIQAAVVAPLQTNAAEIQVSSIGTALNPGEALQIVDGGEAISVEKTADGALKYSRTDLATKAVTVLSQEEAQEEYHNRASVNTEALDQLAKSGRDARLEIKTASGDSKTVKIGSDGKVAVLQDVSGSVKIGDAITQIESLPAGQQVEFNLPAGQGRVVATTSDSGTTYSVIPEGSTEPSVTGLSRDELKDRYAIKVDASTVPRMVTASGDTTLVVNGSTFTVTNLDAAGVATYGTGETIKGGSSVADAIISSGKEGSIVIDGSTGQSTVRIEKVPGSTAVRYIYIDPTGATEVFNSESALQTAHTAEWVDGIVRQVKTLQEGGSAADSVAKRSKTFADTIRDEVYRDPKFQEESRRLAGKQENKDK